METRQSVSIEDILTVEVVCGNDSCQQVFPVNLSKDALPNQRLCPVCDQQWWGSAKGGMYNLLRAILELKHKNHRDGEPTVRLVIPGPPPA